MSLESSTRQLQQLLLVFTATPETTPPPPIPSPFSPMSVALRKPQLLQPLRHLPIRPRRLAVRIRAQQKIHHPDAEDDDLVPLAPEKTVVRGLAADVREIARLRPVAPQRRVGVVPVEEARVLGPHAQAPPVRGRERRVRPALDAAAACV